MSLDWITLDMFCMRVGSFEEDINNKKARYLQKVMETREKFFFAHPEEKLRTMKVHV